MRKRTKAIGLASLAAAEAGLRLSMRVWHSVPGTAALYGAFSLHLALALRTLYLRRHWQRARGSQFEAAEMVDLRMFVRGLADTCAQAAGFERVEPGDGRSAGARHHVLQAARMFAGFQEELRRAGDGVVDAHDDARAASPGEDLYAVGRL